MATTTRRPSLNLHSVSFSNAAGVIDLRVMQGLVGLEPVFIYTKILIVPKTLMVLNLNYSRIKFGRKPNIHITIEIIKVLVGQVCIW